MATDGARSRPALRAAALLPFACLSASFGATLGLIGSGAPLVFRAQGVPLAQIGLIQTIYLPIGLTFLWAGLVDRFQAVPRLPHRIGWIVAMQLATIVLMVALSTGTDWPIALLFALAIATSFTAATMDIALEALVVETVPANHRAAVTTAKLCGAAIGGMLGISLITVLPLSLSHALLVVAALDAIWLLQILRYREDKRASVTIERRTLARLRPILGHAALLGLYFAASTMLGDCDSLVLLDLHVSLPVVGILTGPCARTIQIVMTLAAGALALRFSADRLVLAMASGVAIAGSLMCVATSAALPTLGIAAMILNAICGAALGVPVFTMIYRWAQGTRAATDYAVLFGAAFLAALPARVGAAALAGALGWPLYFALCVPLYVVAFAALARSMRATRIADEAQA